MKAWRVKGKIVGGFLSFTASSGYVFLCMILSAGVLSLVHSFTMQNGGWWLGLTILFIALPQIVFRGIFRYQEVPDGWLLGTFKAWRDRHSGTGFRNVKGNGTSIDWKKARVVIIALACYIGGLNGILFLIVGFGGRYIEYEIVVLIIMTFVIPYLYMKIFRQNVFGNNNRVRFENIQKAKYGIHYKKRMLGFMGCIIFGVLAMFFYAPVGAIIFFSGIVIFVIVRKEDKIRR